MGSTKLLMFALAVSGLLAAPVLGADDASEPAGIEAEVLEPQGESADAAAPPEAAASLQEASADAADAVALAVEEAEMEADAPGTTSADAAEAAGPEPGALGEISDAIAVTTLPDESPDALEDAAVPAALDPDAQATGEMTGPALAVEQRVTLGQIGYDDQGRRGRIHVVQPSDTLWDISEAYLGTPWVWPSIWDDNRNIVNPHRIEPGDRIWITPTLMRRVSAAEAEALLANRPPEPAAQEDFAAALDADAELPTLEEIAPEIPTVPEERLTMRVADRESAGLISVRAMRSASTIIGKAPDRVLLSQEDEVYIGLGEGRVQAGDQFTIFRTEEQVHDPDTGELLGYHVEVLGWLEVRKTYPEASTAEIRMSISEIEVGDHLIPRDPLPARIAILDSPQGVEGKISFFPQKRVLMGSSDYVYLNRGKQDGVDVGTPLEVYRAGYEVRDAARAERVAVPDRVIAELLVVRADTEASVALVTRTETELSMGDRFRAMGHP